MDKLDPNNQDKNPPIKKKRNSYADSPHKLSCPFCPRAFPWVSSLTRHLLTHTGKLYGCRSRGREFDPGLVPYFRGD